MDEKNIITIDLGTQKFAIGAARIEGENIQVTYYKESPSDAISASAVMNESKASSALRQAIASAEESLGCKITQAVVGMPRYYIKQQGSQARIDRDPDTDVKHNEILDLMDFAKQNCTMDDPDSEEVFGAVAQSYSDGDEFQISEEDVIGRYSESIEGNFKVFIGKKKDIRRIDKVLSLCNITPVRKYFAADATAKAVLSRSDMQNGVALIDFGAGVTSVSIYDKGIMRHYGSIPFGGQSITSDIANECTIDTRLAENIKKGYGLCRPDKLQSLTDKVLQIKSSGSGYDKQIGVSFLSEIVTARASEIIEAILYIIAQSGCADNLRGGIVVTGGGAQLGNLCSLIEEMSGIKARIGYPCNRFTISGNCDGIRDSSAAATVGMMFMARDEADVNCMTSELEKKTRFQPVKPQIVRDPEPGTDLWGNPVAQPVRPAAVTRPSQQPAKKSGLWDRLHGKTSTSGSSLSGGNSSGYAGSSVRKDSASSRKEKAKKPFEGDLFGDEEI